MRRLIFPLDVQDFRVVPWTRRQLSVIRRWHDSSPCFLLTSIRMVDRAKDIFSVGNGTPEQTVPSVICSLSRGPERTQPSQVGAICWSEGALIHGFQGSSGQDTQVEDRIVSFAFWLAALACLSLRAWTIPLRVADQQRRRGARCLAAVRDNHHPRERGKNHAALEGQSCQQDHGNAVVSRAIDRHWREDGSDGSRTLAILAGAANDVYAIDAESGTVVWQTKLKWASEKPEEQRRRRRLHLHQCNEPPHRSFLPSMRRSGAYMCCPVTDTCTLWTCRPAPRVTRRFRFCLCPTAKPYGLNLVNNVVYTVTGQGCGGNPNVLYAVDLNNKKVTRSSPSQGGIWGTAGPAVGSDGTVYFETGDGPYDAATGKLATNFPGIHLLE